MKKFEYDTLEKQLEHKNFKKMGIKEGKI